MYWTRTQKDYLKYFMTIVSKNQDQTIRRVDGLDLIYRSWDFRGNPLDVRYLGQKSRTFYATKPTRRGGFFMEFSKKCTKSIIQVLYSIIVFYTYQVIQRDHFIIQLEVT